jgi:hypothetical protein
MSAPEFSQIAILDTETTGLQHVTRGGTARVVQYGLVVLELPTLRYVTHRQALVNLEADGPFDWEHPDVQAAMAVNRLQPAVLRATGASPRSALGQALSIDWRGTCLAAWGMEFDLEMIVGEHRLLGVSGVPWHYRTLDIRSLCAGDQVWYAAQRDSAAFKYLGCRDWIADAHPTMQPPPDLEMLLRGRRAHDALYDAAMTAIALRLYCERDRW